MQLCRWAMDGTKNAMHYYTACSTMLLCVAYEIILAGFNFVVSTPTAKPPNIIPRQIFRLYGSNCTENWTDAKVRDSIREPCLVN